MNLQSEVARTRGLATITQTLQKMMVAANIRKRIIMVLCVAITIGMHVAIVMVIILA